MLRPGSRGEAVRDLQVRLGALGHEIPPVEAGGYGPATERVVRAFQEVRGLRVDGICGPQTWSAVVESGYRLGDRLLYRRRPIAAGRATSPSSSAASTGSGSTPDARTASSGTTPPAALIEVPAQHEPAHRWHVRRGDAHAVLDQVGGLAERALGRGSVRERGGGLSRRPHRLEGRRVFVAAAPGFETLANLVVRGLVEKPRPGAALDAQRRRQMTRVLAAEANRYAADLFLAFRVGDGPWAVAAATTSRVGSAPRPATAVADAVSQELPRRSWGATPVSPAAPTRCSARRGWRRSSASRWPPTTSPAWGRSWCAAQTSLTPSSVASAAASSSRRPKPRPEL